MYEFGSVVLTRFPFTDLSGEKMRPALVISRDNMRRADIVLAFITSHSPVTRQQDAMPIAPSKANGLKVESVVRFDKLVTIETGIIVGKLGDIDRAFLENAKSIFFGVFGFGEPL